jgi:putative protease
MLTFGNNAIDFSRIHVGDKLWKTSDPALEKQWRQSFQGDTPRMQRPLEMQVHGRLHHPLTLLVRDEQGHVARAESAMPLARAQKQPLSTERLREQLGRLGSTPFRLGNLSNHLQGALMLPVRELNRLRRDVVAELDHQRTQPKRWQLRAAGGDPKALGDAAEAGAPLEPPWLIPLVRSLPQLEAALQCGVETVYCDFENPKKYRDAVAMVHSGKSGPPGQLQTPSVYVAPPRIFKPGERWQLEQVQSSHADGYLVRNFDQLQFFSHERCVGDFSLNVANHRSAAYFLKRFGLERVTASYDLNIQQLEALLRGAPPGWFEVTLHQHMPMFHMEHCVFCAFLSNGRDYRDCGRPCDRHDLRLRDRVGAEHPLKADVGCRNTVFNARAQTGAEYMAHLRGLGIQRFRIEFLTESPAEIVQTLDKYRQLLRGEISGDQLWRELKLFNQLGVTRGQMAGDR